MTAHELLALGVDVVVCSYEQVQAYGRAREALPDELDAYNNDQTGTIKKPTRPNAVLHSSFWQELKLPIKRLILDEAQVVNKRRSGNQGVRHGAIKDLFYHSVILLSGTPAHNKWDNFSGLVDFLQGHPFETHHKFMRTFASLDHEGKIDRPDLPRMRLLQRFIQAFTIARPSDILKLKDCIRCRASFHIRKYGRTTIDDLVHRYLKLMAMQNGDRASFEVESSAKEALACAVRAQLMSLSPFLLEESEQPNIDDFVDIDEDDPIYGYVSGDRAAKGEEDRGEWLKKVRGRDQLITESDRVRQFLLVYKQLRRTYPNRKILVFSQYLKFLDILEEALKRAFGISVLRFDGTVGQRQRLHVQQRFKDSDPEVPLLMTAGSGAYGLNITDASIIIQCEIWWNSSVEWQAICRVWRQNQTSEVLAIQLYSQDSAIDQEISKVQVKKADITSELMGPVIRRPGEEPDIRDLCFPIVVEL
jgi:SNF2 family DNA or RNA helicase